MINTVLFDLDGTLLPMDQEEFTKAYFKCLAKKLIPLGYDPEALIKSIWAGTAAMVKNDGSFTNEAVFWKCFSEISGERVLSDRPVFDEFYCVEFQNAKESCGFNPDSSKTVAALKKNGFRVVLATNPIFPRVATESRIRWAGLEPSDFEYFSTYENSYYCKPNPAYYKEILEKLSLKAENCLMVGNDVDEDMVACTLGIKTFLLTDCLINKSGKDISLYPNGNFNDLNNFISCL